MLKRIRPGIRRQHTAGHVRHAFTLLLALGSLLAATGCSSSAMSGRQAGLPNPASEFCIDRMKGRLEIVTDASGGQRGMCHLPDGTVVEEWELLRRMGG